MLRTLRIADFAIIDELALEFEPGLNVLTGETGAGKSIIMQALSLLCGTRGSTDLVRTGADEAEVEAVFDLGPEAREAAAGLGLPEDEELSVRRVVASSGKGRVHLNGRPTSVAVLAQLGASLLHIYGQHEHALLLHPDTHLDLLDDFAGLRSTREEYGTAYQGLVAAHASWAALARGSETARERAELLRFQIQELQGAAAEPGEEVRLIREREVLRHAEQLMQTCQRGDEALYSGEDAAGSRLARVVAELRELARIDPQLAETSSLLESAQAQVDEASLQLRRYAERVDSDPEHLASIDDRLALLRRLARKHDCTADELADRLQMLHDESERLTGSLDLESAREAVVKAGIAAWCAARGLSMARRKAARELQRRISAELPKLGLQAATFAVEFAGEPTIDPPAVDAALSCEDPFRVGDIHLGERGCDRLEFLLGANPGEQARPLAKIASGGELSRIMLSLKVITAGRGEVDTLVFDEVDAGIGGVVAEAVGRRLKDLARARQILCITHLPQIAVHADHHFAVEKHLRKGRTVTGAKPLSGDERVTELSRMLGGAVDSREAERYIRRLVRAAQKEPAS